MKKYQMTWPAILCACFNALAAGTMSQSGATAMVVYWLVILSFQLRN